MAPWLSLTGYGWAWSVGGMMGQAIWDRVLTDRERLASARSSVCSVGLSTLRRGKSGMAEEKKHGPERPGAAQKTSRILMHPLFSRNPAGSLGQRGYQWIIGSGHRLILLH